MLRISLERYTVRSLRQFAPSCRKNFSQTRLSRFPRTGPIHEEKVLDNIPSFREQVARTSPFGSFTEQVSKPSIRNQVLFFVLGSYIAFSFAASKTNADTEYWSKKLSGTSAGWTDRTPSSNEMRRAEYFELGKRLQSQLMELKESVAGLPETIKSAILLAYVKGAQPYLDTTEGRRLCWKICAVNGVVWLAWQLPRLRNSMNIGFMHHPLSGLSYTLLTSMFSHKSFIHLLFNCMALASFGSAASVFLVKEQAKSPTNMQESTAAWHFLAFYTSAGLFSGLVSHVVSARFRYPGLISQLSATRPTAIAAKGAAVTSTKKTADILPSLGASGAIYATLTMTALGFPETQIALLIPPSFPIPIQYGVGGLVAMDVIGALRGWRIFDHYAHLGGAAFGVVYYAYGPQFWDTLRVAYHLPISKPK